MPRPKNETEMVSTTIRLPKELREQLEVKSKKEHWSFNQAVVEAVKALVKDE